MNTGKLNPAYYLPSETFLNGKYRIIGVLSEGGSGITYKGWDTSKNKYVAVKEYFPNGFASRFSLEDYTVVPTYGYREEYFLKRKDKFLEEVRTIARLDDINNIVKVLDFFEENETAYIVMEFLDGITLNDYVEKDGPFESEKLIALMLPLLDSLGRMHALGIIHRDISPENIMYMHDGTLKLYDFGDARDFSADDNKNISFILKPGYTPLEQYTGNEKQGPWTDIYAFCSTVYYCVTGIVPADSMSRAIKDEVCFLSDINTSVPDYIAYSVCKGMSMKCEQRFQTVAELISALSCKKPVT